MSSSCLKLPFLPEDRDLLLKVSSYLFLVGLSLSLLLRKFSALLLLLLNGETTTEEFLESWVRKSYLSEVSEPWWGRVWLFLPSCWFKSLRRFCCPFLRLNVSNRLSRRFLPWAGMRAMSCLLPVCGAGLPRASLLDVFERNNVFYIFVKGAKGLTWASLRAALQYVQCRWVLTHLGPFGMSSSVQMVRKRDLQRRTRRRNVYKHVPVFRVFMLLKIRKSY